MVFRERDLRDILEESLSMISGGFHAGGIQLIKQFAEEIPKVNGDDQQLKQVFFNLLTNARQAMEDKGTLFLRVYPFVKNGSSFVRVEVEDTGKGIDPENLPNIFNPFYTTKEKRLGLGLPIVHRIVTSHQGQIEVDNHPGKGVTFIITLPAKVNPSNSPGLKAGACPAPERYRACLRAAEWVKDLERSSGLSGWVCGRAFEVYLGGT